MLRRAHSCTHALAMVTTIAATCLLICSIHGATATIPLFDGRAVTPRPIIGTTLPAVYGTNGTCPWVNVMKCAMPLQFVTKSWGYYPTGNVHLNDTTGLPLNMSALNVIAYTTVLSGLDGHYDAGTYDLTFEGNGMITVSSIWGDSTHDASSSNGTLSFVVATPTNKGLFIIVNQSHAPDPIRSITIVCREVAVAATTRWHPKWLETLKGNFTIVRTAHWQLEEYSYHTAVPPRNWADRPSANRYTQVWKGGVSHEDIAALALDAEVDLVVSTPQNATEDYLSNMALFYANSIGNAQKLFVVDSYKNGWLSAPLRRIDLLIRIADVFRSQYRAVFPSVTNLQARHLEIVLQMDLVSGEFFDYFTAGSSLHNATFAASVDAISIDGDFIIGSVPYSTIVPNPYFAQVEPVLNDPRRIAWERMVGAEGDLVAFISRWAIMNYSVYMLEGGITFATDMFGERFVAPNSTEGKIMTRLEQALWAYERGNPPALSSLWAEWLERSYHLGVKVVLAGHFITKGIACDLATTHLEHANRYQCNFKGLARYIDTVDSSSKLQGVLHWQRSEWNTTYLDGLVNAPPPSNGGDAVCSPACVWGVCNTFSGTCECDNGYQGADCSVFNESFLPNACSPEGYGINLGGTPDWEPIWYWTNFMHYARSWIHQPLFGDVWSFDSVANVSAPPLSEDGYPLRLQPNHAMSTFLRRDTYEYPQGTFHFFYEGEGTITFGMDTHLTRYVRSGYYVLTTKPVRQLNNGLWFQIRRTNPDNPVRNIRVVPDGQLHRYTFQTFHPLLIQTYNVLRFMPLQHVQSDVFSNLSARTWGDRTRPSYYSQTAGRDGISIEHIVRLANQVHARPWISFPYNADDGYIINATQYLLAHLNPRLRPIVEYSNEVWASDGYAGYYAQSQSVLHGLSDGSWVVRDRACWNQHRARQIWRLMQQEGLHVTRVLAAQAAYTGPAEEAFACNASAALEVDAIGVAPYFGISLVDEASLLSLEDVFARAAVAINASASMVAAHLAIARRFNISGGIFCYEAGPSYFGGAASSDPDIVALGFQVHRDARMKDLIHAYFNALRDGGVTVGVYFMGPASRWGGYGAWGIREYQNQDPSTAYKLLGYNAYAQQHRKNQSSSIVGGECVARQSPDPSSCPNQCHGNGFCMRDGTCECFYAFRGNDCGEYWTVPDFQFCNSHLCPQYGGTCQITSQDGNYDLYTCAGCPSNRIGWMCQFPVCDGNCSFNGACVAPSTCDCYRGYRGPTCNISCNCGGHGVCASSPGAAGATCVCDSGYRYNGSTCVPTCACSTCQGPNLCGCDRACVYGACWNGTCRCWSGFGGASCDVLAGGRSANSETVMGINVAGISDWSSSVEFLNLMWRSREWFLRPAGVHAPSTRWTVNEPITLTKDNYPAFIPFDRVASTFVTRDTTYVPAGIYTVLWDGVGILDCEFDASILASTRSVGYMQVQYTPRQVLDNGFLITIRHTDPTNPIRNIRVYSPEYPEDGVAQSLVFHPRFLQDLESFRTVRFMNWANLHLLHPGTPLGAYERNWSLRNSLNAASMATGYGVNEELMISLCNWLNVEPWISVPHDANDDYIRRLAALIKYRLRPDVRIHIEHSNEVWNSAFESFKYAAVQFPESDDLWDAAISWHGFRSQQIFTIFESVFGSLQRNRLHFKVGTFALSARATTLAMEFVTSRPVRIASTGYFCDESTYGGPAAAAVLSVDELVTRCLNISTVNDTYIAQQVALARTYGAQLDLYESGPSLVEMSALFGGYSQPGIPQKYRSFHLDSRMQTIVKNFYTMQRNLGVDQFCYFTSASKTSIYGNWGIKESTVQSCASAPKCRGTMEWLAANKDSTARQVTWGLAEFGFKNIVQGVFTTAPTSEQLANLIAALEQAMNLTRGSITAQTITNSSATTAASSSAANVAARRFARSASASTNTTVLFIVTVSQASSVNVSSIASNMQSSIVGVASTAVGLEMTAEVVSPAVVISPTSDVPSDDEASSPPAPPVNNAPSLSHPADEDASATIGIAAGVAAGGVVLIVLAVVVGTIISRRCTTTSTTAVTAVECGESGIKVSSVGGNEEMEA